MLEKCDISNEKSVLNEAVLDEFKKKMSEYLENIKGKVSSEDYEKLLNGNYQIIEVYRKAVPKDSLLSNITGDLSDNGIA